MKIGTITNINQKGQIVIPKKLREALAIKPNVPLHVTLKDEGIHIAPITDIVTKSPRNPATIKLLRAMQGAWAGDDWDKMRKKRRKIELAATKRNKNSW